MDEDEQNNVDEALKMYMEAAELCLKLVRCQSLSRCRLCAVVFELVDK